MKEANLIASDAILNFKTIQSFGYVDQIVETFDKHYQKQYQGAKMKAHKIGFLYGLSQFIQNVLFAFLYYIGAEFAYHDETIDQADLFVAIFAIFFAAWSMAQAQQFGPDMGKAAVAGKRVLNILDQPSLINPLKRNSASGKLLNMTPKGFQGTIEFKNVWFRYPTRRDDWVFKGLNLTIN